MTQDNSTAQLLPCPFCGGTDLTTTHTTGFWAQCEASGCQAEGPVKVSEDEAIAAWNTRAPVSQDAEQLVERAREALEKCRDKFAEYVKLHSAKLLPERAAGEFYQNARTAHNAEVCEKVRRNQEMVDLCDQALANPATIRDTDEDAEWLRAIADPLTGHDFTEGGAARLERIANRLASSTPAEPREASGYCPFCMTADPVAPAEGDEPTEAWQTEWPLGMAVEKKSGSSWHGKIVGYYSTALTPQGIAVESDREVGSVQIYPTKAMSQRKAEPDASGDRKPPTR